jgi:hypothetical protein
MCARRWLAAGGFALLTLAPAMAGAIIIYDKDAFQTKAFAIGWKFRTPDGTLWEPGQSFSLKVQSLGKADAVGIIIICKKGLERGQVAGRLKAPAGPDTKSLGGPDTKTYRFAEVGLTPASPVRADRGVVTIRGSKTTIEFRLPAVP